MGTIIRNGIGYGGGGGYTKSQIDEMLESIETATKGIAESKNNYIELENGLRLYLSATEPTDTNVPDGSVGFGWGTGIHICTSDIWS